jgi:hypothetical protein
MVTLVALVGIGYGVRQAAGLLLRPVLRPVLARLSRGGGGPSRP